MRVIVDVLRAMTQPVIRRCQKLALTCSLQPAPGPGGPCDSIMMKLVQRIQLTAGRAPASPDGQGLTSRAAGRRVVGGSAQARAQLPRWQRPAQPPQLPSGSARRAAANARQRGGHGRADRRAPAANRLMPCPPRRSACRRAWAAPRCAARSPGCHPRASSSADRSTCRPCGSRRRRTAS